MPRVSVNAANTQPSQMAEQDGVEDDNRASRLAPAFPWDGSDAIRRSERSSVRLPALRHRNRHAGGVPAALPRRYGPLGSGSTALNFRDLRLFSGDLTGRW